MTRFPCLHAFTPDFLSVCVWSGGASHTLQFTIVFARLCFNYDHKAKATKDCSGKTKDCVHTSPHVWVNGHVGLPFLPSPKDQVVIFVQIWPESKLVCRIGVSGIGVELAKRWDWPNSNTALGVQRFRGVHVVVFWEVWVFGRRGVVGFQGSLQATLPALLLPLSFDPSSRLLSPSETLLKPFSQALGVCRLLGENSENLGSRGGAGGERSRGKGWSKELTPKGRIRLGGASGCGTTVCVLVCIILWFSRAFEDALCFSGIIVWEPSTALDTGRKPPKRNTRRQTHPARAMEGGLQGRRNFFFLKKKKKQKVR